LNQCRSAGREGEWKQQIGPGLAEHGIDQNLGRSGQNEAGEAANDHEEKPEEQGSPVCNDQRPGFLSDISELDSTRHDNSLTGEDAVRKTRPDPPAGDRSMTGGKKATWYGRIG
jgi:hypothetical protein